MKTPMQVAFLAITLSSKAYTIFNKRTLIVEKSLHISFCESNPSKEDKVVKILMKMIWITHQKISTTMISQ